MTARLATFAALVLLCFVLVACDRDAPLSLLTLRDIAPRDVESGERIEITGSGFPRGRTARVTLEGVLHRAGSEPRRGFEIRTEGTVVNDGTIELAYDERLQTLFCGPEGRAVHTTFRGEATVAFAAAVPGAPPASATLPGVVLDLRPPPGGATSKRMRGDGQRFLESVGLGFDESKEVRGGLLVSAVREGSTAEHAGILPGDLLTGAAGVVVRGPADVVPAASAQSMTLTVRRGGDPTELNYVLPVDGYRPRPALLPVLMTALLAALAAISIFVPAPRSLRWLARRAGHREAANDRISLTELLPLLAIPFTVAIPLLLRETIGIEPELVSIVLAILGGTTMLHALSGEGGVTASCRRAIVSVLPFLPAALAIAASGLLTGAARATEATHAQGALPWDFVALRGVSTFVMFAAAICALALAEERVPAFGRSARVRVAGTHAAVFAFASLLVIVLAGGWQSPTIAGANMVGAALFCAKSALLGTLVIKLRTAMPAPSLRARSAIVLVASAFVAGGAALATIESGYATAADARIVAWGVCTIACALALRVGWLVFRLSREPAPRLDPFA